MTKKKPLSDYAFPYHRGRPDLVHKGVAIYPLFKGRGTLRFEYWYSLTPFAEDGKAPRTFDVRKLPPAPDGSTDHKHIIIAAIDAGISLEPKP